jgi:hypothetical protein
MYIDAISLAIITEHTRYISKHIWDIAGGHMDICAARLENYAFSEPKVSS